jgi:hypothetical protein
MDRCFICLDSDNTIGCGNPKCNLRIHPNCLQKWYDNINYIPRCSCNYYYTNISKRLYWIDYKNLILLAILIFMFICVTLYADPICINMDPDECKMIPKWKLLLESFFVDENLFEIALLNSIKKVEFYNICMIPTIK